VGIVAQKKSHVEKMATSIGNCVQLEKMGKAIWFLVLGGEGRGGEGRGKVGRRKVFRENLTKKLGGERGHVIFRRRKRVNSLLIRKRRLNCVKCDQPKKNPCCVRERETAEGGKSAPEERGWSRHRKNLESCFWKRGGIINK